MTDNRHNQADSRPDRQHTGLAYLAELCGDMATAERIIRQASDNSDINKAFRSLESFDNGRGIV